MSCINNNDYRNIPFTSKFQTDFYKFSNITELLATCKKNTEKITKCRTIGILESINGQFILKDINNENTPQIAVSMVYLKNTIPSIVIPYFVQLFGTLQWKGKPILFAWIIQVINIGTAIRLNKTLGSLSVHLAKTNVD